MKRMWLLLIAVFCFASSASAQTNDQTAPQEADKYQYEYSFFYNGKDTCHITIKTRQEELLASFKIPVSVALSIHTSKDAIKRDNAEKVPVLIEGNVSIRTKPRNRLVVGVGAYEQMMQAPLRVDIEDAVVELEFY